jgi:hypothetical protein
VECGEGWQLCKAVVVEVEAGKVGHVVREGDIGELVFAEVEPGELGEVSGEGECFGEVG